MNIKRIVLSVLAMLPMKAVAFAAQSRLTTIDGLKANVRIDWDKALSEKSKLFRPLEITATSEEAFERFKALSGLDGAQAEIEFNAVIEQMLRDGLIETREKMVISKIPSWG